MTTKMRSAVLLAALAATAAFADKVTLKSGSFLTGDADVIRDGKLKFKSADLGDLEIAVENIAKLESDRDHVVQYLDNTTAIKKVTVAEGALAVKEGGEVKKMDLTNVKAVDPELETWHGSVNFSGTATRGNTVAETATVTADLARRWEKDRLTANGGYFFAQQQLCHGDCPFFARSDVIGFPAARRRKSHRLLPRIRPQAGQPPRSGGRLRPGPAETWR